MLERLADELVERPPGRDTWIVPCAQRRRPARRHAQQRERRRSQPQLRGGELGHAAPARLQPRRRGRGSAGDARARRADRSRSARSGWSPCTRRIAWSTGTAPASSSRARWPSAAAIPRSADMGYPCPGSFGTKYGVERGLEVVTLESPYLVADEPAGSSAAPRCAGASIYRIRASAASSGTSGGGCERHASLVCGSVMTVEAGSSSEIDLDVTACHTGRHASSVVARARSARAAPRARRAAPSRPRADAGRASAGEPAAFAPLVARRSPTAAGLAVIAPELIARRSSR